MRQRVGPAAAFCLGILASSPAAAIDELCVDPGGAGGCFTTIQAAIDAAEPAARILIGAGTYNENLVVSSAKKLELLGAGEGSTIVEAAGAGPVLDESGPPPTKIVLKDLTFDGNGIAVAGVEVNAAKLVLERVTVRDSLGRGVFGSGLDPTSRVDATDCTVTGNGNGGITGTNSNTRVSKVNVTRCFVANNDGAGASGGVLKIRDSTIVGNEIGASGGSFGRKLTIEGTALSGNMLWGVTTARKTKILRSTISGNVGGLLVADGDKAIIIDSTIANNAGTEQGGGVRVETGTKSGRADLLNTIVAGNSAPSGPDCFTEGDAIRSKGFLLVQDPTGCSIDSKVGDQLGVDPLLGALADNGGSTETHALLAGSPAVDASAKCKKLDQRGVLRVKPCDIGAFEVSP